jgi:hypothetical protein
MITIEQYLMGRDVKYAHELTAQIRANAEELVGKVNLLLAFAEADGVEPGFDQVTHTAVASGWRPLAINQALERTANAAPTSRHITAEAVDLQDTPERSLATWCLANLDALQRAGLWMERPQWTGGADPWVHLQMRPPRSGKRVFIPSASPARVAALPGEEAA